VTDLPRALALAFAQLADPRILTVLAKVVGITLAILAALYALLMTLLPSVLAQWWGTGDTYWLVITGLAGIIAAWFAFRLVALAVMQFFADEVVRAVEARHYPQAAAQARDVPWREELRHAVRGGGPPLLGNAIAAPLALLLLFTAIGPAIVFGVVNAWLLGRELQDMAWLRHPHYGADAQPVAPVTRSPWEEWSRPCCLCHSSDWSRRSSARRRQHISFTGERSGPSHEFPPRSDSGCLAAAGRMRDRSAQAYRLADATCAPRTGRHSARHGPGTAARRLHCADSDAAGRAGKRHRAKQGGADPPVRPCAPRCAGR
jgi:uncharacterized protein involved in cysteine biosynthesis